MPSNLVSGDSSTTPLEVDEYSISDTDLNRVNTRMDLFPNGGFEDWANPHEPEDMMTSRTQMIDIDLEYSIVSEGSQSARLMAKGTDINHPAMANLMLQSWSALTNPANLTVAFDYYIHTLANADLGDCLELYLPFAGSNRVIYYRIGSTITASNTSTQVYFLIDTGPLQQWNTFSRNVTQDYVDTFGTGSIMYLSRFQFRVISYEYEWSRAYIDNVYFVNGSYVKVGGSVNSGNIELGGTGSWWWGFDSDAGSGDISQCTTRVEADWSLNMTINTVGNTGFARFSTSVDMIPTVLNKDQFSFYWNIADWQVSTYNSRAYMWVEYSNRTASGLYVFYIFGYGGGPQIFGGPDDIEYAVDGFNTTGVWNLFNRSVIDDIHSRYPNAEVLIESIYFYASAEDSGSRVSVLFDDASLTTSILHDGGYEDQKDVGEPIYGWDSGFDTTSTHTVTDFSCNGEKAANITLVNSDEINRYQEVSYLTLDDSTEYILDLNWYIETLNQTSEDYLLLAVNFIDNTLFFLIANSTSFENIYSLSEYEAIVLQPETNSVGSWINWQIDIVHAFESAFGAINDNYIYDIEIWGSADLGSKLVVFMDDLYIYEDPSPDVLNVQNTPTNPSAGGSVLITATVIDATLTSVVVNYRVNGGSWTSTAMSLVSNDLYELNIMGLIADSLIEYNVTAVDAFGKTTSVMDDSGYFTITVASATSTTTTTTTPILPTDDGALLLMAAIAVAIIALGAVFIIYVFVLKKR